MLGAIIGDVVGSRFEFNNIKTKDFELFSNESTYTDDTVLTIAVMDWLLHSNHSKNDAIKYLQKWAQKYPNAGYGGMFYWWKDQKNPKPYFSYGNGSAMRISACGWYFDDLDELKKAVKVITEVTHNHPEGLKGAEVTAVCIYLARKGKTKQEIKKYIDDYYDVNLDYEELRKTNYHGLEICQIALPQALFCFLNSNSFEDCLRMTVSIGGDTDTLCAISCAIAEAYYKDVSETLITETLVRLDKNMNEIIKEMDRYLERKGGDCNERI